MDYIWIGIRTFTYVIIFTLIKIIVPKLLGNVKDVYKRQHAYKEGEGDRSLAYWRDVHEDFFAEEFAETELEFNGQTSILCEEFKVVYRAIDVN